MNRSASAHGAAVSPLWLLAPLTIAIGFSLPPFLVAKIWGQAPSALS